jgi:transcriptional regulator with XRE-family HTH domain
MASVDRVFDRGTRRGTKALRALGEEYRDKRVAVGLSQAHVARAVGVSRSTYSRIEAADVVSLSVVRANQIAAVLGLDLSVRTYPGASPLRDAASLERLEKFLRHVANPLVYRTEVPLPPRTGGPPEQRAWDALISGLGRRTGVELEMRLRDIQALERRLELKRRDDPVDSFVLLVADTRGNRTTLTDNPHVIPRQARLGSRQ